MSHRTQRSRVDASNIIASARRSTFATIPHPSSSKNRTKTTTPHLLQKSSSSKSSSPSSNRREVVTPVTNPKEVTQSPNSPSTVTVRKSNRERKTTERTDLGLSSMEYNVKYNGFIKKSNAAKAKAKATKATKTTKATAPRTSSRSSPQPPTKTKKAAAAGVVVPSTQVYSMGGTAVDRKELYGTIEMLGGFDAVVEKHLWTETARRMRLRLSSSTGSNMKRIYLSYFPFGCPLEPWMTAKPSSSFIPSSSRPTPKSSTARRRSKPQKTIKTMQKEKEEDEDEETTTIRHTKKQKEFPRIPAGNIHDHDVTEDFTDIDDERLDHQKDDAIQVLQTKLDNANQLLQAVKQERQETFLLLNYTIESNIDMRLINVQLTQELNDRKQQMVQVLNTIETAMKDSATMSAFRSAMGCTVQTSLDKQVPPNMIKRPRSDTTNVSSVSPASSQQGATDPVSKKRKIN